MDGQLVGMREERAARSQQRRRALVVIGVCAIATGLDRGCRPMSLGHLEDLVLGEPHTGAHPGRDAQHRKPGLADLPDHALPRIRAAGVVVDDHQVRPQIHADLPGFQRRAHRGWAGHRRRGPCASLALHMQLGSQRRLQFLGCGKDQPPPAAGIEQLVVQVVGSHTIHAHTSGLRVTTISLTSRGL